MKKIIPISIFVIFLLLGYILYYQYINSKLEKVIFSYDGIDGIYFKYDLKSEDLSCNILKNKIVNNGDHITVECSDSLKIVNRSFDYEIEGLYTSSLSDNEIKTILFPIIKDMDIFSYKTDSNGISLIGMKEENGEYVLRLYENLFIKEQSIYKLEINKDDFKVKDSINTSFEISNIRKSDLETYMNLYTDKGFVNWE